MSTVLTEHSEGGKRGGEVPQAIPGGTVVLPSVVGAHTEEGQVLAGSLGPDLVPQHPVPGPAVHRGPGLAATAQVDRGALSDVTLRAEKNPGALWGIWTSTEKTAVKPYHNTMEACM